MLKGTSNTRLRLRYADVMLKYEYPYKIMKQSFDFCSLSPNIALKLNSCLKVLGEGN